MEEMDKFQKVYKMTLKADVKVGIFTYLAYLETGLLWSGIKFWKMKKKRVRKKSGNVNFSQENLFKRKSGNSQENSIFP